MTILVIIKNEETSNGEVIHVHFSDDSAACLIQEGETAEFELMPDVSINLSMKEKS